MDIKIPDFINISTYCEAGCSKKFCEYVNDTITLPYAVCICGSLFCIDCIKDMFPSDLNPFSTGTCHACKSPIYQNNITISKKMYKLITGNDINISVSKYCYELEQTFFSNIYLLIYY